jgi:hypothetical protein
MNAHHFLKIWILLLLGLMVVGAIPAAAQDVELDLRFTMDDGTTFRYPSNWDVSQKNNTHFATLSSDRTRIVIPDAARLSEAGISADTNLLTALRLYFTQVYQDDLDFDYSNMRVFLLNDEGAMRYDYEDPGGAGGLIILIKTADGLFGVVDAVALDGDLEEEAEVVAIAGSLQPAEADVRPGDAPAAASHSDDATPCTVRTESANTVAIRVGPGLNRTSIAFLPTGQDFAVLGKAEADDGSLWWKVDRAEVAPKKSAAEAWIAQEDVEASGGCEAVLDVNAPPVIPIMAAPPATTGGGDSGGGDSGGQPAGAGEITPQTGRYTVTYPATVPGSCLNSPTQNIPFNAPPDVISLTSVSSTSLNFGGDVLTRVQPNTYQGLLDLLDVSVRTTVRVYSATTMTLEFILTGDVDGSQCSITITGTMTHQ